MHAWGQKAFQERNKWTTRMGVDCVRKSRQISSVTQSCPRLCDPMDCSMPSFLVHHQLQELAQIHAHWVKNGIQLNKYSIVIKKSIHFEKIMYWGMIICMHAKMLQLCLTLYNLMDYSPLDSSIHGSPSKNTGVGCHALHLLRAPSMLINGLSWWLRW